jgi:hypothetical protein
VILSRDTIRRHLALALHLDPRHDYEAAVAAVAQALGIEPELVREAAEKGERQPEAA